MGNWWHNDDALWDALDKIFEDEDAPCEAGEIDLEEVLDGEQLYREV